MLFSYKGKTFSGEIVSGDLEAPSKIEVLSELRAKSIIPLLVQEKKSFFAKMNSISFFNSVKLHEKILFTKNLSGMLKAGLSITHALQVLQKQTVNKYFKKVISTIEETIDKGGSFSDGLEKYPKVFSALFVSMVRAGEESGGLSGALTEIGENLEKSYQLNRKIKSAMMYPSIIMLAIIIIGVLMFIYVVPTLTKTFKEMGTELPASTKFVIGLSDLLSNHALLLLVGVIVLVGGVYLAFKNPKTKRGIDWLVVRLPMIGTLIKEVNAARTARTLSSLLSSGVTISRAIQITHEVLQNVYYKEVLKKVEEVVEKGIPISTVFKENLKLYPVMVGEMMEVGEETGKLSAMLFEIAVFYEAEVDAKTKDLSTIIEPVLMIFIGGAVGFFAVSMLSPMYSVMDGIK